MSDRPSDDESRDETEALRAEVARLRADAQATSEPGAGRARWRTTGVALLVAIATVIAPLSVVATWARDQIVDTDSYLKTVRPLGSDPDVLDAVAARVTYEILTRLDVPEVADQALSALAEQRFVPERAKPLLPALSTPLSDAVENFVGRQVRALVHSDEFATAWVEANRQAHTQLVAALTGEGTDHVDVANGTVSVNLAAFIDTAKQRLVDKGFGLAAKLPTINASFTIFASDDIARAQQAVGWLELSAGTLPAVGLALLVVALVMSADRRRTALAIGLSIAAVMLALGIALNVLRQVYLDSLPSGAMPLDVAGIVYDTLVHYLRSALRSVAIVALVVALVAFLSASSGSGRRLRSAAESAITWLRRRTSRAGFNAGPVGAFLGRNRGLLRVVVCIIGAVAYLTSDHPSGTDALMAVVGVGIAVAIVELLAVRPESETNEG